MRILVTGGAGTIGSAVVSGCAPSVAASGPPMAVT